MSNFTQKGKAQDPLIISLKRPESKTEPVTILPVIEEKKSPAPRVEQSKPRQRMKIPRAVLVALLAVLIGLVSGAGVFWFSHRQSAGASRAIATPKASPSRERAPLPETTEEIVRKVSKLMVLPSDETPSIAIVKDVNSLKDQLFFKNARNGNFVLMYAKARRAVLYDAETDKVIEVAPITDTP